MLPFTVVLRVGEPVYEQVTYAVKHAVVSGQLRAGDEFPSVRELSRDLKINPNTAHRIVARLLDEGLLVVRPGIGTIVGQTPCADAHERARILGESAERLVIDARHAGASFKDIIDAIRRHWTRTGG